jgi:hypothetical protein
MIGQAARQLQPNATDVPELRDIHVPADPSWWPPAAGWWLLAVLVLALLFAAALAWRSARRRVRARRLAWQELEACRLRHARDADDVRLATGLHQLLRRVARLHDPDAVRQQGAAWRATLQRVPVTAGVLQQLLALEQAMYRGDAPFDPPQALAAVRTWLALALRPRNWKPMVAPHA